jgi:hypothetical protein
MGHTFPTAVSVGITLGKLCSIYETSFGEVEARISSSLYLSSHIPAGPLELTEEERQGKGGNWEGGGRKGREDLLSLNGL